MDLLLKIITVNYYCKLRLQMIACDIKLVRQSQIVQSVMQDCKYVLSHLLPVCDLLVQGPKITYNYCLSDGFKIKQTFDI